MSYNEDEELEGGFKMGADADELGEPLEDEDIPDFKGLDDEDESFEKDRN